MSTANEMTEEEERKATIARYEAVLEKARRWSATTTEASAAVHAMMDGCRELAVAAVDVRDQVAVASLTIKLSEILEDVDNMKNGAGGGVAGLEDHPPAGYPAP
jgi:hypothetical protein